MDQDGNQQQWLPDDMNVNWADLDNPWGNRATPSFNLPVWLRAVPRYSISYVQPETVSHLAADETLEGNATFQPWPDPWASGASSLDVNKVDFGQMSLTLSTKAGLFDESDYDFGNLFADSFASALPPEPESVELTPIPKLAVENRSEHSTRSPQDGGDHSRGWNSGAPQRGVRKAKSLKKRLPCQYPGCKLSFPRKYELERHQSNIHQNKAAFYCYVYGCNRISKPFARADKFREHLRTRHKVLDNLICIFDECNAGPFTLALWKDHVSHQHSTITAQERHLNVILKPLKLRRVPSTPGHVRLGNENDCPLAFLGCEFRIAGNIRGSANSHLMTHYLHERSKGYNAIKLVNEYWVSFGAAHCPICNQSWDKTRPTVVANHVASHSKDSRAPHLAELSAMFMPILLKNELRWSSDIKSIQEIGVEIEEAGLMLVTTT